MDHRSDSLIPAQGTNGVLQADGRVPQQRPTPWWRVGMVWLVLAGPMVVVVAGITTAVIAVRGADPVLNTQDARTFSERPAVQGRNHAVTAGSTEPRAAP